MNNILNVITFLVLLLFSLNSFAQVWVNPNAVWTYDYSGISEGGTFKWKYTHDSIIQGRTVQALKCEKHQFVMDQFGQLHGSLQDYGSRFTSVSGDTVFHMNNNQFYVLYNFGASIGDQWIIDENPNAEFCNPVSSVQVTDTGSVLINGQMRRTITLETLTTGEFGIDGIAVEGIGLVSGSSNFGMFPGDRDCPLSGIVTEWYMFDFRCFDDDMLGTYNPGGLDCNYLTVSLNEKDLDDVYIFPNPTSGIIKIENVSFATEARIIDLSGQTVLIDNISPDQKTIDFTHLSDGAYFLEMDKKRAKILKINY